MPTNPEPAIVKAEPGTLAEASSLMHMAVERGLDMQAAWEVYERACRFDSVKQYNAAMTAFHLECPSMPRTGRHAGVKRLTARGVKEPASYTTLEDIDETIDPILKSLGLSYDWEDTKIQEISGKPWFQVSLRIRHTGGHSEIKTGQWIPMGTQDLQPADLAGAAQSRARRMALIHGFGLSSVAADEADMPPPGEPMTEENARQITELLDGLGHVTDAANRSAWERRIFERFSVESVDQLPADKFDEIASKIQAGIDKAKGGP